MKKVLLVLVCGVLFLSSCADSKEFTIDGKKVTVEPYGIISEPDERVDGVVYKVSTGNVICSVVFCETIFVPIWLVGWDLYEPISYKDSAQPINN